MTNEFINKWAKKYCSSEKQIKADEIAAAWEVEQVMPLFTELTITTTPLKFFSKGFKTKKGFVMAMFVAAEYFKGFNDVIVRYSKPEDENGNIAACFEILKSKSKVFLKYLIDNKKSFNFVIATNKDVKSAVKFFNSIGIKGEERTQLNDLENELKDAISNGEALLAEIKANKNNESDYSEFTYSKVSNSYKGNDYNSIKQEIEQIISLI